MLTLYTDGGARGNPGPAAIAYMILDSTGNVLEKGARFVGERTNNEAEYEAILWGLEKVMERSCAAVRVITDSELVARQINGRYKVRDRRMQQYADKVAISKTFFDSFEVVHARRTDERVALVDALVNEELERKGHPKK
jgi:ribonuclease HI